MTKRIISIAAALVFLAFTAAGAAEQAKKSAPPKENVETARIVSIDATAMTLMVATAGKTNQITVPAGVKIMKAGKEIMIADLKVGEKIFIHKAMDGMIMKITVHVPQPAKKKAAPAPKK